MISEKKMKFRDYKAKTAEEKIAAEAKFLEKEKLRQEKIEVVSKAKLALQDDVQRLKDFNKEVAGPSKLQRIGAGLRQASAQIKQHQKKQEKKGMDFGGNSGGPDFGMGKGSPFKPKK